MAGAFPNSEYVQYSECALNMEVPGYTSNFYPQNTEFSLPESRYEYMEAGDRTPWTWGDQLERGFHCPELQVGPALQEQEMLGFQDGRWELCPPPAPRLERLERGKSSVPLVTQAELLPLGLLDSPVHSPTSSHPAPSESNENYGPDTEGRALRDMLILGHTWLDNKTWLFWAKGQSGEVEDGRWWFWRFKCHWYLSLLL